MKKKNYVLLIIIGLMNSIMLQSFAGVSVSGCRATFTNPSSEYLYLEVYIKGHIGGGLSILRGDPFLDPGDQRSETFYDLNYIARFWGYPNDDGYLDVPFTINSGCLCRVPPLGTIIDYIPCNTSSSCLSSMVNTVFNGPRDIYTNKY